MPAHSTTDGRDPAAYLSISQCPLMSRQPLVPLYSLRHGSQRMFDGSHGVVNTVLLQQGCKLIDVVESKRLLWTMSPDSTGLQTQTAGSSSATNAVVPEPTTRFLLMFRPAAAT